MSIVSPQPVAAESIAIGSLPPAASPARLRALIKPRIDRLVIAAVALEMALAGVLGSIRLGSKSFYLDEAYTVHEAGLGWSAFWHDIWGPQTNMQLYYLLMRGWVHLGQGEAVVRSLSVVFFVATVPILVAVARRLFDTRTALIAGLLFALNEFAVSFSQEARTYSLVYLLITLSTWLLLRALDRGSRGAWAAYVAVAALSVYAHMLALLVVAGQLITVLVLRRGGPSRGSVVGAGVGVGLLASPVVLSAFAQRADTRLGWLARPSARDVGRLLVDFAGHTAALLAVAAGLVALALWPVLRAAGDPRRWATLFTLGWLVLPAAAAVVVSVEQPVYTSKYLIGSLPALVILVAAGLNRIRSGRILAALLAVCVGLGLVSVRGWYTGFPKDDWRSAESYVASASAPGDALVLDPDFADIAWDYYATLNPGASAAPTVLPGWDQALAAHRRLWVIVWDANGTPPLPVAALSAHYRLAAAQDFTRLHVQLYLPD